MSQKQAKRMRTMEQELAKLKCELMVLRSRIFINSDDINSLSTKLEKAPMPQKQGGIRSLLKRYKLKYSFLG